MNSRVFIILFVTVVSCSKNPTSPEPAKQFKIAFKSADKIYLIPSEGGTPVLLNNDGKAENRYAWSPDGSKIAYAAKNLVTTGNCNSYRIFMVNNDGTNKQALTHDSCYFSYGVTWSSDGRLAFDLEDSLGQGIYVMSLASGIKQRVTPTTLRTIEPQWAGLTKIVFVGWADSSQIWRVDANGNNPMPLTAEPVNTLGLFSVSPDGLRIAYCAGSGQSWRLYLINIDGTSKTPITPSLWDPLRPVWSPDGKRILVPSRFNPGYYHISIVNDDSTGFKQLTSGQSNNTDPDWSPDGSRICYVSESTTTQLFTTLADGTDKKPLTTIQSGGGQAKWSPVAIK